jgi:hypothetical protein
VTTIVTQQSQKNPGYTSMDSTNHRKNIWRQVKKYMLRGFDYTGRQEPRMPGSFISVVYHMKIHMVSPIEAENAFNKIPHSFMIFTKALANQE